MSNRRKALSSDDLEALALLFGLLQPIPYEHVVRRGTIGLLNPESGNVEARPCVELWTVDAGGPRVVYMLPERVAELVERLEQVATEARSGLVAVSAGGVELNGGRRQ